jgi:hypothetical protein
MPLMSPSQEKLCGTFDRRMLSSEAMLLDEHRELAEGSSWS